MSIRCIFAILPDDCSRDESMKLSVVSNLEAWTLLNKSYKCLKLDPFCSDDLARPFGILTLWWQGRYLTRYACVSGIHVTANGIYDKEARPNTSLLSYNADSFDDILFKLILIHIDQSNHKTCQLEEQSQNIYCAETYQSQQIVNSLELTERSGSNVWLSFSLFPSAVALVWVSSCQLVLHLSSANISHPAADSITLQCPGIAPVNTLTTVWQIQLLTIHASHSNWLSIDPWLTI